MSNALTASNFQNELPFSRFEDTLKFALELQRAILACYNELLPKPNRSYDRGILPGIEFLNSVNRFGDRTLRVDYEIEERIISFLNSKKIAARIVSEEHGELSVGINPKYTIVLDGVDGSTECLKTRGQGKSCCLVAVLLGDDPLYKDYLLNIAVRLANEESILALPGQGCYQLKNDGNFERIKKSDHPSSKVYIDHYWEKVRDSFLPVLRKNQIAWSNDGVCSAHYLDLVTGDATLNLECTRKRNLEPLVAYGLIKESGGVILDQYGDDIGERSYFNYGWQLSDHQLLIAAASLESGKNFLRLFNKETDESKIPLNDIQSNQSVELAASRFLSDWRSSISQMGSELQHLAQVKVELGEFRWEDLRFPAIRMYNAAYPNRDEKLITAPHYKPKRVTNGYEQRLKIDECALCRRVAAAVDDMDAGVENPIFIYKGHYGFVFPNRFPVMNGHSLWVPKDHDLPRTTYARSLSAQELSEIFQVASTYSLVAIRNHPHDGMTLPQHDHFHLLPANELKAKEHLMRVFADSQSSESGKLRSPFATLIIKSENQINKIERILQNLERAKVVYTLCYFNGYLFVTPRHSSIVDKKVKMGGGIGLHILDQDNPDFYDNLKKYVPRLGEFDWNRMIITTDIHYSN